MSDGEGEPDGPSPEDDATANDREGGRQFGRAMMVVGAGCAVAGLFFVDDQYMVFGGLGLVVVGAVAYRWPAEIVRLFTGMGDKL